MRRAAERSSSWSVQAMMSAMRRDIRACLLSCFAACHRILFWVPGRPSQTQEVCLHDFNDYDVVWVKFTHLNEFVNEPTFTSGHSIKPDIFQDPSGTETPISHWTDLLVQTAEWLVCEGLLTEANCPLPVSGMRNRYLINIRPEHRYGRSFSPQAKELSNGLFVECQWDVQSVALRCVELLTEFGQDPTQFQVQC